MSAIRVAVTFDEKTLRRLDRMVKEYEFPNRSKAIQDAVKEKVEKLEKNSLYRECKKLNPTFEKALGEEGMAEELMQWPEY